MSSAPKAVRKKRFVERPDVRQKLLDAAEFVVRNEGYGAATVRRIAGQAGMTHQAVGYYFGGQEELMLELLRRGMAAHRERMETALNSESPIRAMWNIVSEPDSVMVGLEFMALAYHNDAVRKEIVENGKRIRALEAEAIERYLEKKGITPRLSPPLVSILTNALARFLVEESTLGIDDGHDEVERLVESSLSALEAMSENSVEIESIVDALNK